MANTFLTPDVIAAAALANLYENTVMANLVHRDYEPEFANKVGDTITIRKPATFVANDFVRANGIQIQDATESSTSITLNKFKDVSFAVTAEDMTLSIKDFSAQLLDPAMQAIAEAIDRDILSLRDDVTNVVGLSTDTDPWDDPKVAVDAGSLLDQANVPQTERRLVVGARTKAAWVKDPLFHQAQQRGDTTGLREASLGARVFGFDPYMSQNVKLPAQTTGNPTTEVSVGFHRTAFALCFRPLALPQGAKNAAIMNYKGFGLRVVYDYDITKKQDVISVDCLYGVKTLDPARAVVIHGDLHA